MAAVGPNMTHTPPVETALTGYGRTVSPDASATAAARTLRDSDVSILVVEDDGIEGVVTESDFVSMVAETTDPVPVSEIMSSPPVTASPTTPLSTVAEEMRRHGVERVPVVDSEKQCFSADGEESRSSDNSEEPHTAADQTETDDGTYWGFVSTESVAFHFGTEGVDVEGTAATDAATAPVTSD